MQSDVCAEFDTRRLFLRSAAESGNFFVLIENLILRDGPKSMICDITTSLEANHDPVFKLHKCDVET